ncbi:MAG: hypothetical protein A2032_04470 [Chloroflexi bacterium RBG_19FT_COMBO_49_13]|nr:MAG: hypothetical protein A2Y53_06415 [Chloroflexi bacterium RBG_16_47_49]OGO60425.1 MAG: hypothetical protein A2032_04470 [Chloroflexi bacterium RBG_19FT_COMBO_49_13]
MSATNKIKWSGSIILAGTLLVLAMMGGTWGTTYAADPGLNAAPIIDSIDPTGTYARSPDRLIYIYGANFGNQSNTRVRITGIGVDQIARPEDYSPGRIIVVITDTLLIEPTYYNITVVKSTLPSIPTIPLEPEWDQESNQVIFTVYEGKTNYLPFISR